METTNLKRNLGYILAVILFLLLSVGQYNYWRLNQDNERMSSNVKALNDTIRFKENKIGTLTASKKAFEVTNRELKKQMFVQDERLQKLLKDFKTVSSATIVKQEFVIKEIPVRYTDTVPCIFERITPIKTDWYSLTVESNQLGNTIKDLKIPNTQYIVTGYKGGGFFGTGVLEVDVSNSNKYINTTNIETQIVKIPQPFYESGFFKTAGGLAIFGLGFYAGRQ